jgi:predicted ATPase
LLTRLQVRGFKNLVDVDVRFGPFTCIAGANGIGKSNLFDAILFLSALAEIPFLDAAMSVRDETGRSGDIRTLFHRTGDSYASEMSFEAEMIVPPEGTDDLGQPAHAKITFLRYAVALAYRREEGAPPQGRLELVSESLTHIRMGDAHSNLHFPHSVANWRRTAVKGSGTAHRTAPFISTDIGEGKIRVHQDGGSGNARSLLAASLPRTALSTVNAAEAPTATMARKEMRSWRMLQLEPSCLRRPDPFTAPPRLGTDGSHLAATLYRLASRSPAACTRVANRLSELIGDVRSVSVERDERRELLTLTLTGMDGVVHPARALSDGTLRFLALAVLDLDPETTGLLCLEEPENGIHPDRIPAILELLRDIAMDVNEPVGPGNPLRQVIVNTHSPSVVSEMFEDDVLIASLREFEGPGHIKRQSLSFGCLPNTWRDVRAKIPTVPPGTFLPYLKPIVFGRRADSAGRNGVTNSRVADREDLQAALDFEN